ncbi:hypothetical protein ACFPAF_16410 [Hymenobacter endophyticus]|uniref:Uncharacterized protein n=1 Tax=Hymenobacter endophyticus TaxID=3076335 RepID=A0ABU3TKT4_9BACT|nr:hypothetical protein [Hymenobacter endophyticus]MDU0371986.1 hypothetical protein [Hymenobacter endophyticus]
MTASSRLAQTYFPVAAAAMQEAATFLLASHPATRASFPPGGGPMLLNMLLGFFSFPVEHIIDVLERGARTYPASPLAKTQILCSGFRKGAHRQTQLVVLTATQSLQAAHAVTPDAPAMARLTQLFNAH